MSSSSTFSSSSPCAACKFLRRKCTPCCVFGPYFPADQPKKFLSVHKVFGASNVAKILHDVPSEQREDAVNSLAYEADARLHDPVYGCVGYISILHHRVQQLQRDVHSARKELVACLGPAALVLGGQQQQQQMALIQGNPVLNQLVQQSQAHQQLQQQQQQQRMMEALSLAAAVREEEFLRGHGRQHHQGQTPTEYSGGGGGYEVVGGYYTNNSQVQVGGGVVSAAAPPAEVALVPQGYDCEQQGAFQSLQHQQQQEEVQQHRLPWDLQEGG